VRLKSGAWARATTAVLVGCTLRHAIGPPG
jgi:hypothetical protein